MEALICIDGCIYGCALECGDGLSDQSESPLGQSRALARQITWSRRLTTWIEWSVIELMPELIEFPPSKGSLHAPLTLEVAP